MTKTKSAPRRNTFTKTTVKKTPAKRTHALRFATLHHLIDAAIDLEADPKVVECAEAVVDADEERIKAAEWRFLEPSVITLDQMWARGDFNQVAYALGYPYGKRLTRSVMAPLEAKMKALHEMPPSAVVREEAREHFNNGNAACVEMLTKRRFYEPSERAAPLVAALKAFRIATTGRSCVCRPCIANNRNRLHVAEARSDEAERKRLKALAGTPNAQTAQ